MRRDVLLFNKQLYTRVIILCVNKFDVLICSNTAYLSRCMILFSIHLNRFYYLCWSFPSGLYVHHSKYSYCAMACMHLLYLNQWTTYSRKHSIKNNPKVKALIFVVLWMKFPIKLYIIVYTNSKWTDWLADGLSN